MSVKDSHSCLSQVPKNKRFTAFSMAKVALKWAKRGRNCIENKGKCSFVPVIAAWLEGKAANSKRAYRVDIARFRGVVSKPLAHVTVQDLAQFERTLSAMAPATKRRTLATVKSLLSFAQRSGYVPFNASAAIRTKRSKNTIAERILNEGEVLAILEAETIPHRRIALEFLYQAGVRVSELCGLKWRDLQPNGGGEAVLTVYGKGDKTRWVRIGADLHQALKALRFDTSADAPLLTTARGNAWDQPRVFRLIRDAAKRGGVDRPVSPHWFRHASATHALENGAPLPLVRDALGHSSVETTSRYLHSNPKDGLHRYLKGKR